MRYFPKPIDTSDVEFPEELEQLLEILAKNVHDQWATGRISEGWVYGKERNDKLKQTPCLVEYNDLPEAEKNFDRTTARETLKVILKSGYRISKNNT